MKVMRRRFLIAGLLFLVPASWAAWTVFGVRFEPPEPHPTGAYPLDVVAGDIDGDGLVDVLTANRDGRSISVFLGNGRGELEAFDTVALDAGATSLALAEMNADGHTDVVVSACNPGCTDNSVTIPVALTNPSTTQRSKALKIRHSA